MNEFRTISLRLLPELHKKLKIYAIEKDKSVQDTLIDLIEKELQK